MQSTVLLTNEFGSIESYIQGDNITCIKFTHKTGSGIVSLHGGQVLSWIPNGEKDVFWLSKQSYFNEKKAIRGGIPLCWPWFGGDVKKADKTIIKSNNHGFVRDQQWQLTAYDMNETNVVLELSITGENCSAFWPTAFRLVQQLTFSTQFEQTLTMVNLSEHDVYYTGALHSYFAISHLSNIDVPELNQIKYIDKLSDNEEKADILVNFIEPIDRIYSTSKKQCIIDKGWQRKIIVSSTNCENWVLWNPGHNTVNMDDMFSGAENEFVCLEAANTSCQVLLSNKAARISQCVKVEKLKY